MDLDAWGEHIAQINLQGPLPRRWSHSRGVAARARTLAPILGRDTDLLTAAAWLHDVGYAPALAGAGFHPLDGARYLRDVEHTDDVICRLVAHHSCACVEAQERGLAAELAREFPAPPRRLADALTYCDMTTSPVGDHVAVDQRLAEIRTRYAPDDPVSHAIDRSAPLLTDAVARVMSRLARATREQRNVPGRRIRAVVPAT